MLIAALFIIMKSWKQPKCSSTDIGLKLVCLYMSWNIQFSSVQFSLSVVSDSLQPHESQHARPPCPSPTPGVYSNSCPLSQWCHPAISSSVIPFLLLPPPAPNPSQHQGLFQWVNSLHEVAKVLEFQPQHQSFQWTPSHKKDWIIAFFSNMDGPRKYAEWVKSDKDKYYLTSLIYGI